MVLAICLQLSDGMAEHSSLKCTMVMGWRGYIMRMTLYLFQCCRDHNNMQAWVLTLFTTLYHI